MSGINVPNHFYTQFANNIDFLLQQRDSRLAGSVNTGTHSGEKASPVDQVGTVEVSPVTDRFSNITRTDSPLSRRWVFPISYDLAQMLDTFDALKLLLDPKSKYVQSAVMAFNRQIDRAILGAAFATSATGVAAAGSEAFGTALTTAGTNGQNVDVSLGGTTSSLNVAKLKEAKRRIMNANVDVAAGKLWCAISSKEHDSLLNEIQIVSLDFNDKPVLVDGLVTRFLGINFKFTELIQTGTDNAAGTSNMIPMWESNGLYLGTWQSQVTDISQRKDLKGLPWQAYVMSTFGATRLELQRVIRIWCR